MPENRISGLYGDDSGSRPKKAPDAAVSVLSPPGLVSILIPCCGQLEYTKLCVPSLLRHSREPFELIFVDIGSLDGTAEYLAGLQAGAANLRVEIVRTQTDLGIRDAVKEAIAEARGEYVALLNNDTVVTDNWINQMIALAGTSPAIGLVGHMSNYAAPPQLVETVPYRFGSKKRRVSSPGMLGNGAAEPLANVEEVYRFAWDYREKHSGSWVEAERLGGFCLLIKRIVLEKIGSLDQWSDLSLFDSDILSSKARQAGFTLACCRDLYIHHFGTRTFAHGSAQTVSEKS